MQDVQPGLGVAGRYNTSISWEGWAQGGRALATPSSYTPWLSGAPSQLTVVPVVTGVTPATGSLAGVYAQSAHGWGRGVLWGGVGVGVGLSGPGRGGGGGVTLIRCLLCALGKAIPQVHVDSPPLLLHALLSPTGTYNHMTTPMCCHVGVQVVLL